MTWLIPKWLKQAAAIALAVGVFLLTFGRVKVQQGVDKERERNKAKDRANADDIRRRAANADQLVRKLDDAGYRDRDD